MEIYFYFIIVIALFVLLYRYVGVLSYTFRHTCLQVEEGSRTSPEIYLPKPKKGLRCKVEVWLWPFVEIWDKVKPDPHRRKRVRIKEHYFRLR